LVWSFPVTPNYAVSHQWLRELKREDAKTLIAVVFRIDDDEPVFVRHYREGASRDDGGCGRRDNPVATRATRLRGYDSAPH
jgi:hypothetical protein